MQPLPSSGMRLIAAVILSLIGTAGGLTQSSKPVGPVLELRLAPDDIQNGVPQAFTILLVNTSDHDVSVPSPSINCGDTMNGVIWLRRRFVPLKFGSSDVGGTGCASSTYRWPSILERAKQWKVLRPGESLRLQASRERLRYESKEEGTYYFWADYSPPFVSPEDRTTLTAAGIDFPGEKFRSTDLTFQTKP